MKAKALLVEDNPADVRLLREIVRESPGDTLCFEHVTRLDSALERLQRESFDVVLLDLGLPDSQGMKTLELMHKVSGGVPIVILTGLDDERFASEAVRAGAQDYLVKGRFDRGLLVRTVRYAIERKLAEEALSRLNRELRAISNCNQTLLRATDEQTLLKEICRIVCEEAGYRLAWVGYAEHDEAKSVRPVAWTGAEEGYLASADITWADTDRGRGPTGTAIRSGETCCIEDFAADPRLLPWRESLLQRDFRSGIALPLKDENGNAFGSLTIHSAQPNAFTPEEIRLLEELAGDLAFGIVTLRSRAARKQAEQEVTLLSFALDKVREGAFLVDDTGRFRYGNEEGCRVLGYAREELLGMGVADIDPDFPAGRWSDHWRDLKKQRSLSFESRHRTRDGRIFPVEVSANYFEYGGRAYNLALVRDITERKRAEEALRQSEAYLAEGQRLSHTGSWALDVASDKWTYWSEEMFRIFGFDPQEGIPARRALFGRILPEDRTRVEGNFQKSLRERVDTFDQYRITLADGTLKHTHISRHPVLNEAGEIVQLVGSAMDITERKRIEETIRRHEAELRQVLDLAPQLVAEFGPDRQRLYANRPTLDYFGVTLEEWRSIPDLFRFFHPDDRERMARDVYTGPASDVPHEFEARMRRNDGTYRWFLFRDNVLRDEQGRITRWYLAATDIEDRKRAEEERQAQVWFLESMDRINRAMQGTNDLEQVTGDVIEAMLSIFNSERAFLYYPCDPDAPSFEAVMQRTRPEYPGAEGVIPMTPDTARGFQIMRASSGVVTFGPGCDHPLIGDFAKSFSHKSSIGIALCPKTGQPWVLAMHQCSYPRVWTPDERKLLEEIARRLADSLTSLLVFRSLRESEGALGQSESYLAEAQRLSHTGSWAFDIASDRYVYVSEECLRIFGFDPQKSIPTGEEVMRQIHPEDRNRWKENLEKSLREKVDTSDEYRITLPDGTVKHLYTIRHPVLNDEGEVVELVGTSIDITERKQAEESQRRTWAYLTETQRLTHTGTFVSDNTTKPLYWSEELFRIFGFDPQQGLPTRDQPLQRIHPEDLDKFWQAWQRGIRNKVDADVEYRVVLPDGTVKHVYGIGHPVLNANGELVELVGTTVDITERKRAEEALRQSKAYLTEAQRLSHTGSWAFDIASDRYVYVSEEDYRIFGFDPQEGLPTREAVFQRIHPEDRDKWKEKFENSLREKVDSSDEYRIVLPDGTVKHIHTIRHLVLNGAGDVVKLVGTSVDITERKQAEEALRESETRFRTFVDHAADALVVQDLDQGTIVDVNRQACESLGYTRQELIGNTAVAFHLDSDGAEMESVAERAAAGESVVDTHYHRRKDGTVFPVEANTSSFWYGGRRFLLHVSRDITDRLRAEEKLRQSEAELRQLVDVIPQQVFVFDTEWSPVFANRRELEYTGLTSQQTQSKDAVARIFHPEDLKKLEVARERARSDGAPFEIEARIRGKDGEYRWFLIRDNPLRDEQGRIIRWYGTRTDIEDRKRAEERLQHENVALRDEIDNTSMFEEIVGTSAVLQTVLSRVSKVAPTDSTVLITGETGTGKELVARAIHRHSHRSSCAFVSVNCAAIPRDLIASELFGHERGAFTGATQRHVGRFELAEGGTIFLDEVGDLPAETQIALLRVLQEHEFERVGGTRSIQTNVRVIAATNRDLQAAIEKGTFREDLFYRLNVFPIEIPPLRKRREDVPLLVEYFINRFAKRAGKNIRGLSKKTLDLLQSYPWPGNIRELQNVIERSVIVCETEIFSVDKSWLSPQPAAAESRNSLDLAEKLAAQEKEMIEAALRECGGRVFGPSGAAARLGMPRSTLESKIRSLKINKNRFKSGAPSKAS
jgi:formate hydrogenlyase transcriptional activator